MKCRENTKSNNPVFSNTNKGSPMLLSKRAVCIGKRSRFMKGEEARKTIGNIINDINSDR